MFLFTWQLVVGDVSAIHPTFGSCARAAARLLGWAAAHRDDAKERAYQRVSSGLPFVPLSVESFGRLRASALSSLRFLVDHAVQAGGPGLFRDACISGALQELGVTLCRGNGPVRLVCPHSGVRPGPVARPLLSLGQGGLRLSAVACLYQEKGKR
jgi:hypothetical protein